MSDGNPWRHASKWALRAMVVTASNRWKKAVAAGDMSEAAQITARLTEVNRALDAYNETKDR